MRQGGKYITGFLWILGCLATLVGFMQISHADTAHKQTRRPSHAHVIVKKITSRERVPTPGRLIIRPALRPVASRDAVMRRAFRYAAEHHPIVYRHALIRRIAVRRPDYRHGYIMHHAVHRFVRRANYLWCVPYARDVSHIDLTGDAFLWWAEAAGRYARGERPQPGAVLNFRSSARIPLGHVAVVSKVIDSREVLVDQANWVPDSVSRNVPVIDVSPDNNWSEVEVSIGDGRFGMTYPTYGFIYDRQPGDMIYANSNGTEVADAPISHKIRLIAPNRTLR